VSLSEVPVGFFATIKSVHNSPAGARLISLGFIPGASVKVVRAAPLGDPRVYNIMDKLITLRNDDANLIEVLLQDNLINLSNAPRGIYSVVNVIGGRFFKDKMAQIGVENGSIVEVIRPFLIKTNKGTFQVGRGMSGRIILRRIEE